MVQHVAVLMGGLSSERSVSLRSGEACAKALEAAGYIVTRVDVGADVATVLTNLQPDVALNALTVPAARTAPSRACSKSCAFPTPIRACWPPRSRPTRTRPSA